MKVTVEFDCSPEEARRLLGLPDLSSLHESYIQRLQSVLEQGVTPDMVGAVLRTWSPMGEAGLTMWKQMLDQVGVADSRS